MHTTTTFVLALLTGCAHMSHISGQPMEVRSTATPAGVSQIIQADAHAEMVRAQAACPSDPASCGFMPYPSVDRRRALAKAWNDQYINLVTQQDTVNASVVLNEQLVMGFEAAEERARKAEESARILLENPPRAEE